jgi:glyoxylase-like metal-dependent hydrolase (beta-lactamase superfamily II)
VTVVDAGLSGQWDQLEPGLRAIGLGLDDVAAVVLTHGHSDHTGVAGVLHDSGVPVYLHASDHELLRTGKESWKREGSVLPHLLKPRVWSFFAQMARGGALRPPLIDDPVAISDGDELDVPGRPRVIHTPGHTPGHCVFHFAAAGALFAGDLLCTWNPLTGRLGPQIMPAPFNASSEQCLWSVERCAALDAATVLPGHGEPWTEGTTLAVERALETGRT